MNSGANSLKKLFHIILTLFAKILDGVVGEVGVVGCCGELIV